MNFDRPIKSATRRTGSPLIQPRNVVRPRAPGARSLLDFCHGTNPIFRINSLITMPRTTSETTKPAKESVAVGHLSAIATRRPQHNPEVLSVDDTRFTANGSDYLSHDEKKTNHCWQEIAGHPTQLIDACRQDVDKILDTEHEQKNQEDDPYGKPKPNVKHDSTDAISNTKRKAIAINDLTDTEPEEEDYTDHSSAAEAKARKKGKQWRRKQRKRAKMDQWMQVAGLVDSDIANLLETQQ